MRMSRWWLVVAVVCMCLGAAGSTSQFAPARDVEIRLYNAYGQIAESWHAVPGTARPMYGEATIFIDSNTGKRFTIKGATLVIVETIQDKVTLPGEDEGDAEDDCEE